MLTGEPWIQRIISQFSEMPGPGIAAIILGIDQSTFIADFLNFSWQKRQPVKHSILDLWAHHSHLKIVLAYNRKLRPELVGVGE